MKLLAMEEIGFATCHVRATSGLHRGHDQFSVNNVVHRDSRAQEAGSALAGGPLV